jgi:hypothetical protein
MEDPPPPPPPEDTTTTTMDVETDTRPSFERPLATELIPGAALPMDEEEEPTPVKRLDVAFETVTHTHNPLEDAPALQVVLRIRPLPPAAAAGGVEGGAADTTASTSCMQIVSDRKVRMCVCI